MKKKEIILVVKNTSWWKEKKYRRKTAEELRKFRKQGWKLNNKKIMDSKLKTVNTNIFKKYFFVKE